MSIRGSTRAPAYFDLASFPGLRGAGGRGREGLVRTVCACVLISQHSGNSVLRTDNSVTTAYCPDYHLAVYGSASIISIHKRREAFAFAVQRLHYLSLEHRQVNTIASAQSRSQTRRKSTRSHGRILYILQRLNRKTARLVATLDLHRGL